MGAHSTVSYVEPNLEVGQYVITEKNSEGVDGYTTESWRVDDEYERAPRLEDYCIALNIEVEVGSRDSQGQVKTITLQWSRENGKETVSFMGGTKIGGYDYSNNGYTRTPRISGSSNVENLTTYYADMYVGDLINYGTTEMIGIKSVDIRYEKGCVPIISIKFTDVRGFSLFQPQELNRNNLYDGIRGLDKDNVAQSFFQCFFKLPMPKFTITIKGFYGKPVAYVMMCDKFETNFNSETGDYDVDTRFIGYSYSFMTDLAFEALLAAPYSDFGGEDYWNDNKERFVIKDRQGQPKTMPRLMDLYKDFYEKIKGRNEAMLNTTLNDEERYHTEEIAKLRDIVDKYKIWYETLFNFLKKQYKRYCFEFRDNINDENSDWYRILILTNSKTSQKSNLSEDYKQYSEAVKNANNNLLAAINDFNSNPNNFQKLDEISKDFSKYTRIKLFNNCYINHRTKEIEFGGFDKECRLNKTEILNRMFYGTSTSSDESEVTVNSNSGKLKEFTLNTIYGDGTDQYTSAYLIEVDYSNIIRRINVLVADAAKSDEQKDKEKRRKAHNESMLDNLCWYPSVENFSKIMMAHVETFMHMLYNVQQKTITRTPESLGITIGPNGNACDVNVNTKNVPPFPRVIKDEVDSDGITRKVDTWIGDFKGSERFIEEDMINGLFNGIGKVEEIYNETNESSGTSFGGTNNEEKPILKYPITSFDFFLTQSPYGGSEDITNNPYAFVGKVMIRMFNILQLNCFKNEYSDIFLAQDFVKMLGELEAENFNDLKCLGEGKVKQLLGNIGDNGLISPQSMIDCVIKDDSTFDGFEKPWEDGRLMYKDDLRPLIGEYRNDSQNIDVFASPLQGELFTVASEFKTKAAQGKYDVDNEDVSVKEFDLTISNERNTSKTLDKKLVESLINSNNKNLFNTLFIVDDFKKVANALNQSSTNSVNSKYLEVYNTINENSIFNKDNYKNFIQLDGVFKPKLGVVPNSHRVKYDSSMLGENFLMACYDVSNSNKIVEKQAKIGNYRIGKYVYDKEKIDAFASEAENGNITSWTFTECRGFGKDETNNYQIKSKSHLNRKSSEIESLDNKVKFFLMGLDAINYQTIAYYLSNKTFTYLPKLAILQIGAALDNLDVLSKENNIIKTIKKVIPVPSTFHNLENYFESISSFTKICYVKYYRQWLNQYGDSINDNFYNDKNYEKLWSAEYTYQNGYKDGVVLKGNTRLLFDENNGFVNGLNNQLMTPVLVAYGTTFSVEKEIKDLNNSIVVSYLDGFLTRLRELNGIKVEENNSAVKLTQDASTVTESMKKDLYRYLKLAYERWIPLTTEKEWAFETFFDYKKEEEIRGDKGLGGHMFHFIDSYYNKIGDKLLLNPQTICDLIARVIESKDTNTMMLGFMADILGKSKCMLYSIQNFMDLADKGAMSVMFKPIPYNSMMKAKKHPDFVVVYPYQPSRYLNIDNGDFNDDSFMLNDEFATPLPIRSRCDNGDDDYENKKYYRIPAFGVSYGKQYQSFFKKVNVGMKSPIATVQSITAKHAILKQSQDVKQTTQAQDVYDIYAAQAYTCEVEMMGCAWVQPLMYFVLTNVPMFKGSYMIQKVTHSITPGNMTTNFVGVRMPNVANKIEDEIFTDADQENGQEYYSSSISRSNALANVDNDCPYKVYPLYETDNIVLDGNTLQNAKTLMETFMGKGFNKQAAAGIVGNIMQECSFDHTVANVDSDGYIAGGICGWNDRYGNLTNLSKDTPNKYGQAPIEREFGTSREAIPKAKAMLEQKGLNGQINFLLDTLSKVTPKISKDTLNACASPSAAAEHFRKCYEKGALGKRQQYAEQFYAAYESTTSIKKEIKPNQNVYDALLNAVQKSLVSTNRSTKLCKLVESKSTNPNEKKTLNKEFLPSNGIKIVQQDNGRQHLSIVFDILLNGYYDYVQELYWVLPDGNGYTDIPSSIHVVVEDKENVKPNERIIGIYQTSQGFSKARLFENENGKDSINELFLQSIAKRYHIVKDSESTYRYDKTFDVEVPQLAIGNFAEIIIKNCDSLMENENIQRGSEISKGDEGMIDGWNVGQACDYAIKHAATKSQHDCAAAVERAIAAGGGPLSKKMATSEKGGNTKHATNLRYYGILESHGFVMIDYGTIPPYGNPTIPLQAGDVAIIGKNAQKEKSAYHACMYTSSRGWVSDFFQNNMNVYGTEYPYAIYRFNNKQKA